jgi:hypothetical protein
MECNNLNFGCRLIEKNVVRAKFGTNLDVVFAQKIEACWVRNSALGLDFRTRLRKEKKNAA